MTPADLVAHTIARLDRIERELAEARLEIAVLEEENTKLRVVLLEADEALTGAHHLLSVVVADL